MEIVDTIDKYRRKSITILMAEDDADDRYLVQEAFRESRLGTDLHFKDGHDLMDDGLPPSASQIHRFRATPGPDPARP